MSKHVSAQSEDSSSSPAADGRVPALMLRNVSKSFAGKTVLSSVSLSIAPGEVHALLGQNGSGKSTLIKVLSGYHHPDEGSEAEIYGAALSFGSPAGSLGAGCRFVHQDLGLIGSETVLDNLAVGSGYPVRLGTIRRGPAMRRTRAMLQQVGLDIDPRTKISDLSPAEATGVAVARAMSVHSGTPARVLVLDEPTATLPADEVQALLATLRAAAATGLSIIYVTHHLDEVFQIADRVSVLRDGHLVTSSAVSDLTRSELVGLLTGELQESYEAERLVSENLDQGATALAVTNLSAGPIRDLSFSARSGEILGFYGITGSGRESLLSAVFGARPREGGIVEVAGARLPAGAPARSVRASVGYLPPDRKVRGGAMELSARENFTLLNLRPYFGGLRIRRSREVAAAKEWFARLDVRPRDAYESPLKSFSGGNQQKILLAKWLMQDPKVLLLDEPTQGVDIGAKAMIHHQVQLAAEGGMAVVLSSTDEDELAAVCSRVLIIHAGRVIQELSHDRLTVAELNRALHMGDTNASTAKEAS